MRNRDASNPPEPESATSFDRTPPPHPTTDQAENPTVEVSDPTPARQERGNRGPEEEPGFGQGA